MTERLIEDANVRIRLLAAADVVDPEWMEAFGDWPAAGDMLLSANEQAANMLSDTVRASLPLRADSPLQSFTVLYERVSDNEILGAAIVQTAGARIVDMAKALRPAHRGLGWGSKISNLWDEWVFADDGAAATLFTYQTFSDSPGAAPQVSRAKKLAMRRIAEQTSPSGHRKERWRLTRAEWLAAQPKANTE